MRPSLLVAAGVCALALSAAAGGVALTSSDFNATTSNTQNTFTAADANTAPTVSATAVTKSAGGSVGYVKKSGTFYVYANATDTVGVSSVTASVTNITGSSTAATLTSGSYTSGGVSYGYRSALLTASSTLTAGTKAFTVTATDASSLTGQLAGSVTADITAPSASAVATANKAGSIAGKAELGDTATVTFSEPVDPSSIISGWDGTATTAQVAIIDGGGQDDLLRIYAVGTIDPNTFLPSGTFDLGGTGFVTSGSYAVFGLTGSGGTSSTVVMSANSLIITLGSLDYGTSSTTTNTQTERYTPVATITDRAGNASGTSTISATGSHKVF